MVAGLPPFWGDTIKDVYKKVINTQPKFPAMSAECQSCIERLLHREPSQRLGAQQNGADIAAHDFFAGLSWPDLLARQIRPPFKSKSAAQDDTQNFHKAFTGQKVSDSLDKGSILSEDQERNFEGFTYVPGLAASAMPPNSPAAPVPVSEPAPAPASATAPPGSSSSNESGAAGTPAVDAAASGVDALALGSTTAAAPSASAAGDTPQVVNIQ